MLVKRFDLLTNDLCVVYMIVHFREFLRIRSKNDRRSNATMSLMNADEETDQQLQLCVVYFCSLNLNDCIDKKSEEKFDILNENQFETKYFITTHHVVHHRIPFVRSVDGKLSEPIVFARK